MSPPTGERRRGQGIEMCIRDRDLYHQEFGDSAAIRVAVPKITISEAVNLKEQLRPVSYTHLDVYKRQFQRNARYHGKKIVG